MSAPRDLAVKLNVSQGQIARVLRESGGFACPTVGRYLLESWAREMRDAEAYLRHWFKGDSMTWKIEQNAPNEWAVRKGSEVHFAQTPEDAVSLKSALEKADQ